MNPWDADLVIERGYRAGAVSLSGPGVSSKGDLFLYAGPDQDVAAVWAEAPGGADAWAKFFCGAPGMAWALRDIHTAISDGMLNEEGVLEVITKALTYAGVPIP